MVNILKQAVNDSDIHVRYTAVDCLHLLGYKEYSFFKAITGKEPKTPEEYIKFLRYTENYYEWVLCIKAQGELKKMGKKAIPALLETAQKNNEPARCMAIETLGEMKAEEAIPLFTGYLKEEAKDETTFTVQSYCISALLKIDTEESIKAIKEYGLSHKNPEIRYGTAVEIYGLINPISPEYKERNLLLYPLFEKKKDELRNEAKKVLLDIVEKADAGERFNIALLFVRSKEKEGIPILIGLLRDRKYFGSAKNWLESTTGQRFGKIPPVVSKKMLEEYIKKWEVWWEKNKDTFQFPQQNKQ
ncbi:MAG TPA: hypothetical protein P5150_09335 [Candidatus Ratteibacteria bacterium]|nr:hypothetical protein [Candidatus Ratteibacteria bacterium]